MSKEDKVQFTVYAILLVGIIVPTEGLWLILKIPALFIIVFTAWGIWKESQHGHHQ